MKKHLIAYIIVMTWILTMMDWKPIHNSYIKYNDFPHESVHQWWGRWTAIRYWTAMILCPPCGALAEHYYFSMFEVEAGLAEREDLLLKHIPNGYEYEGVPSPSGFWWGQGGEDNSNEWKRVSLLSWWLYWLPPSVIWWYGWGFVFRMVERAWRRG